MLSDSKGKGKKDKLDPSYTYIVQAVANVAKRNYGVFSVVSDFDDFKRELEKIRKGKGIKGIGSGIPKVDNYDMLKAILDKYMYSEFNKLGLNYDNKRNVFYFETIIKESLNNILNIIHEIGRVVTPSEVARRLGISEIFANVILDVIKDNLSSRGIVVIPDRVILDCIDKASVISGRSIIVHFDDLYNCVKGKIGDLSPVELKSLINRLIHKGIIKQPVEVYDNDALDRILQDKQENYDSGLIPADSLPDPLLQLMNRKGIILKVSEPGYYLPLYTKDNLKSKSIDKFANYISRNISNLLKTTFEENNFILSYNDFLKNIQKFVDESYNISQPEIRDLILQKVEQGVSELLNLKHVNRKVVIMENELKKVIEKIKHEVVNRIIDDLKIAVEIKKLKDLISEAIETILKDYWGHCPNCYEFMKNELSIDELANLCRDKLTSKGWEDDGTFIMSKEISKYKKEIIEELKNRGVLIGEKRKMLERVKEELKDILGQYNIDSASKSALEEIIVKTIDSLLRGEN